MYHSLRAGKPVHVDEVATLADGLQGGVLAENRHTFGMCQRYLDEIMLVSEDQIADVMTMIAALSIHRASNGAPEQRVLGKNR